MELDEQLREEGERWREAQRAPVADFARATARSGRWKPPQRSRQLLVVPIIVIAALVTIAVAFFSSGGSSGHEVIVTRPATAAEPPSVLTLDPEIMQTQALAIDGASVWVTGNAPDEGQATLEHIDTKTGRVLGTGVLPDNGPFQIVVGDGAVWVCSQQNEESAHLIKIDPEFVRVAAFISTDGDATVAITPDAVWVDVNTGKLLRLDPETNQVLATIPLPGGPYSAHFITAGPLGVFLANNYDGTVLRVDEATNTVKVLADIGTAAGPIVELDGWLWANAGSSLVKINPTTGVAVRAFERNIRDIATDGRWLWASTDGPSILRFDPRTRTLQTVQLPTGVGFAIALAGDPATGAVWAASDPPTQRVFRVSP